MRKVRATFQNVLKFGASSPTAAVIILEIIVGIVLITFSLLAFADITKDTLFDKDVEHIDMVVSQFIYSFRSPFLNEVMTFISLFGADFILMISSVMFIFMAWTKHKRESTLFAIMLVYGALLNLVLKAVFQRPRPTFDPLFVLNSYSFPSGHAMNSFVFYATVAYLTYHFTKSVKVTVWVSFGCALLILLIGISRIYLGVHYPSDVLAGYIAGFLWFVLVLLIERTLIFTKLYKKFVSYK